MAVVVVWWWWRWRWRWRWCAADALLMRCYVPLLPGCLAAAHQAGQHQRYIQQCPQEHKHLRSQSRGRSGAAWAEAARRPRMEPQLAALAGSQTRPAPVSPGGGGKGACRGGNGSSCSRARQGARGLEAMVCSLPRQPQPSAVTQHWQQLVAAALHTAGRVEADKGREGRGGGAARGGWAPRFLCKPARPVARHPPEQRVHQRHHEERPQRGLLPDDLLEDLVGV